MTIRTAQERHPEQPAGVGVGVAAHPGHPQPGFDNAGTAEEAAHGERQVPAEEQAQGTAGAPGFLRRNWRGRPGGAASAIERPPIALPEREQGIGGGLQPGDQRADVPRRIGIVVRHPEEVLARSGGEQRVVVLDPGEFVGGREKAQAFVAFETGP